MKMRTIRFILIAAAAVLAVSCAEERSEPKAFDWDNYGRPGKHRAGNKP